MREFHQIISASLEVIRQSYRIPPSDVLAEALEARQRFGTRPDFIEDEESIVLGGAQPVSNWMAETMHRMP